LPHHERFLTFPEAPIQFTGIPPREGAVVAIPGEGCIQGVSLDTGPWGAKSPLPYLSPSICRHPPSYDDNEH